VTYKGYTAEVELDEEQGVLFGRVIGLRDVITFQAESVAQAIQEFHASVDSYLELCRTRNESPEKPYSGRFVVRVAPDLHRQLAALAQQKSISLNSLVTHLIRQACLEGSVSDWETMRPTPAVSRDPGLVNLIRGVLRQGAGDTEATKTAAFESLVSRYLRWLECRKPIGKSSAASYFSLPSLWQMEASLPEEHKLEIKKFDELLSSEYIKPDESAMLQDLKRLLQQRSSLPKAKSQKPSSQ
jgi:predicted HicB family RNase H-like nuclease